MSDDGAVIDPDKLAMFSFQVFSKLEGAVTSGMIHLGDRLGLYTALRTLGRPVTSVELADAVGLHERWVREWAYNQAAAKLVDRRRRRALLVDPRGRGGAGDAGAPGLRDGHVPPLAADDAHARRHAEQLRHRRRPRLRQPRAARARSASSAASSRGTTRSCCRPCCPRSTASSSKLTAGATVADVGCGAGGRGAADGRRLPEAAPSPATTSRSSHSSAPRRSSPSPGVDNARFLDPRVDRRCLPTTRSISSRRSTASTT